jgi:hypothetical protein
MADRGNPARYLSKSKGEEARESKGRFRFAGGIRQRGLGWAGFGWRRLGFHGRRRRRVGNFSRARRGESERKG